MPFCKSFQHICYFREIDNQVRMMYVDDIVNQEINAPVIEIDGAGYLYYPHSISNIFFYCFYFDFMYVTGFLY